MSVDTCIKMSFTQLENHSHLLCGHDWVRWIMRSAECGVWKMKSVENAECGKCGVWKMRSVENVECGKCEVWKMRSVDNVECGKCVQNFNFPFFFPI